MGGETGRNGIEEFSMGEPHLVATTFYGGIYVFTILVKGGKEKGKQLGIRCINMVRPVQEDEFEMGIDTVPMPSAI